MKERTVGIACGLVLLAGGGALLGGDAWLSAKEMLARVLIRDAFSRHLADGAVHRPWSWADMAPVARIDVPGRGIRRYVLTGATGESLAFDIGHIHGTSLPNRSGNCVLTGHRDGRFAFLEDLGTGETVVVRTFGSTRRYQVESRAIVDAGDATVLDNDGDRLTLVTCWPFHGLAPSPWRYVVSCRPMDRLGYAGENHRRYPTGHGPVAAGPGG